MRIIKIAQYIATLNKDIHSRNNRPIYYVTGNTFPIKDQLKSLNFSGFRKGREYWWWKYENTVTPQLIEKLKDLNIDTSIYSEKTPKTQDKPKEQPKEEPKQELTNKTDWDENVGYYQKYLKFPVKKNIYETSFNLNTDKGEIPVKVVLSRSYKENRKTIPSYKYTVFYKGEPIHNFGIKAPGRWGTYNEDDIARRIPEMLQNMYNNKKMFYRVMRNEFYEEQFPQEFKDFLEKWSDYEVKSKPENLKNFMKENLGSLSVNIKDPEYQGTYEILARPGLTPFEIWLYPYVEHSLAPDPPRYMLSVQIPTNISNPQELHTLLQQSINENNKEIEKQYIEYLKTFPFKQEQEKESIREMNEIVSNLQSMNTDFFMKKLIQYGYIRPNRKKMKQSPGGFVPQENITFILDQPKIRNGIYGERGKKDTLRNQPEKLYALLGYNLMRLRDPQSFGDVGTEINFQLINFTDVLGRHNEQYKNKENIAEFEDQFTKMSQALYQEIFGEVYRNKNKDWFNWFYGGSWTEGEPQNQQTTQNQAFNDFYSFAVSLGANPEQLKEEPRKIYRQLMQKYHPDRNKEEAEKPVQEQIASKLSILWKQLPDEIKRASNWYNNIKSVTHE